MKKSLDILTNLSSTPTEHNSSKNNKSLKNNKTKIDFNTNLYSKCSTYNKNNYNLKTICCNKDFCCIDCTNICCNNRNNILKLSCHNCDHENAIQFDNNSIITNFCCRSCNMEIFGHFCLTCNFISTEDSFFHCKDCNICKLGTSTHYKHCNDCNTCISTERDFINRSYYILESRFNNLYKQNKQSKIEFDKEYRKITNCTTKTPDYNIINQHSQLKTMSNLINDFEFQINEFERLSEQTMNKISNISNIEKSTISNIEKNIEFEHNHITNTTDCSCPICAADILNGQKVILYNCGHSIHLSCAEGYLEFDIKCCICKKSCGNNIILKIKSNKMYNQIVNNTQCFVEQFQYKQYNNNNELDSFFNDYTNVLNYTEQYKRKHNINFSPTIKIDKVRIKCNDCYQKTSVEDTKIYRMCGCCMSINTEVCID